jgi:hypothetical protein
MCYRKRGYFWKGSCPTPKTIFKKLSVNHQQIYISQTLICIFEMPVRDFANLQKYVKKEK